MSATALSKEVGIPQPTLSSWVRRAANTPPPPEENDELKKPKRRKEWTPAEKLRVLSEAERLGEAELGALLRREGLHSEELARWRAVAHEALEAGTPAEKRAQAADRKRIKELERELRRKEKALAETAAFLVLRKKLEALHWYEDDTPDEPSENESSPPSPKR